jgi:very-short-patch-repair endonuclease
MTREWWAAPPARQVSYLTDIEPDLLRVALDPLPTDAPAVVVYRPFLQRAGQVDTLLAELDRVAMELFPRWLPGAESLDGSSDLGRQAVRALAKQAAERSENFGPFLADLAERSLSGNGISRFPAEVRALGLSRVIADAYGRSSTVLLIDLPVDLAPADERGLTAAAEWLAHHGHFTVWLTGAPLRSVDRIRTVSMTMPSYFEELLSEADSSARGPSDPADVPVLAYPPLSGIPHPGSPAERALEQALAQREWAQGRRWNHHFEASILAKPYRLDLFWSAERLVVEVDGDDHRQKLKYADDRHRDNALHGLGYLVLRFTNEEVHSDVGTVALRIKDVLTKRRETIETRSHAHR